ncbi:MAG: hypothetical protein DRP89_05000, partial [Candidatus Neomarinimicrobiota bacterium]
MHFINRITISLLVLSVGLLANSPPYFTTTVVSDSMLTEDVYWGIALEANDDDVGDVLTFSLAPGAPDSMTILDDLGWITWTPRNEDVGTNIITAVVSDGELTDSLTFRLHVKNTNDPPSVVSTPVSYVYEDMTYRYVVVVEDVDVNDVMHFTLNTAPEGMTITPVSADSGEILWYPDNGDVGLHDVFITVEDDSGVTDTQEYTFEVHNVRGNFTTLFPTSEINEDQEYNFNIESEDELQGNTQYSFMIQPTWLNIDATTGVLTGAPDNSNVGLHNVKLKVDDGNTGYDTLEFNITVINTPPEITTINPTTSVIEDNQYSFDFNSSDDGQGTINWYSISELPGSLSLDQTTGVLSGVPLNDVVGSHVCSLYVDDGNTGRDTISFNLEIINKKPNILTQVLDDANEGEFYSFDLDADDEQLGTTSYSILNPGLPDWLTLVSSVTGELQGIPDNGDVGPASIIVAFDDGNEGKDTTTLNITVRNKVPTITTDYDTVITEDNPYSYDFDCSEDGQGNIVYHANAKPSWLSLNSTTGLLAGTPSNNDVGEASVSIFVSDGNGGSDTASFTLTINNRDPVLESTAISSAYEDSSYAYDIDFDDEGEGATYSWNIKPDWLSLNTSTGEISGIPRNSYVGDNTVSVKIDDGKGGEAYETFVLNVVNAPPVFTAAADTSIKEDSTLTIDVYTDDEGDPTVTYALINPPANMVIGSNNGIINFTPDNSQVDTFTVSVLADDGNIDGISDTLKFDIIVENTLPLITTTPPDSVNEWQVYKYDINSIDEGVGNTQYSFFGTPPGWLSIDPDSGIVSGYTDNSGVGDWGISVKVSDGNGGADKQSWTLTVVNKAPEFSEQTLDEAVEDYLYNYTIQISEPFFTGGVFSLVGEYPDWLSLDSSTGVLSGTPINSDVDVDTITIKLDDKNGGIATEDFELTVANSKPDFLTVDDINATEDQNLSVDLQANDEGDEGSGTSGYFLINPYPDWLSINQTTGVLSGIPRDDDVGTSALQVKYLDGNDGSDTLEVSLIVANANPSFTTTDPTNLVAEDQTYSFQFHTDDDDWGGVTFDTLYTLPVGFTLSSSGLLSGSPTNASVGSHTVGIVATDGNEGEDNLIFNLEITNVYPGIDTVYINPSPTSTVNDTSFLTEDVEYTINIDTDDEGDGDNTTYTVNHIPVWLSITDLDSGKFSGTPTNAHVGQDYLEITFTDGNGGSVQYKRYLTVNNVVPTLEAGGPFTAIEDREFSEDLSSSDEGQGSTSYSFVSGNPGWLTLNSSTGVL